MNRRQFCIFTSLTALTGVFSMSSAAKDLTKTDLSNLADKPNSYWKSRLTEAQYYVLREHGTEKPFSSDLNYESRDGLYVCAACELPLFESGFKYDSKTGWPSFFNCITENVGTQYDFKLIYPRKEYHCKRCKGHQGHVFNDGPQPTGLRYCNNGVALKFLPAKHEY